MKTYSILLIIRDFALKLQGNIIYTYGTDEFKIPNDLQRA